MFIYCAFNLINMSVALRFMNDQVSIQPKIINRNIQTFPYLKIPAQPNLTQLT